MKQSVVKSTLAVALGLGLIGAASTVDAQILRLTFSYSDADGNASAVPTEYSSIYAARITGADPFEIRAGFFRIYYALEEGAPTSFEIPAGRTLGNASRVFNAGPDGDPGNDGNPLTDRFGVSQLEFTAGGGFPLADVVETVPVDWMGGGGGGAFAPILVIGWGRTAPTEAFGITGNPLDDSGVVVRPVGEGGGDPVRLQDTIGLSSTEGGSVLAVEMVDLNAKQVSGGVLVSWETGLEIDNAGFNVYSAPATAQSTTKLNPILIGAAGTPASYSFMDSRPLAAGESRQYFVEDVEVNGLATTLDRKSVV